MGATQLVGTQSAPGMFLRSVLQTTSLMREPNKAGRVCYGDPERAGAFPDRGCPVSRLPLQPALLREDST